MTKPDPLKQPCRECGAIIDLWDEPYMHHPDGSYQHFPPCPKPPAPTVIETILAKHRATPGGYGWSAMSCRECRTTHTDPCDVQELGHYIHELEEVVEAAEGMDAVFAPEFDNEEVAKAKFRAALEKVKGKR